MTSELEHVCEKCLGPLAEAFEIAADSAWDSQAGAWIGPTHKLDGSLAESLALWYRQYQLTSTHDYLYWRLGPQYAADYSQTLLRLPKPIHDAELPGADEGDLRVARGELSHAAGFLRGLVKLLRDTPLEDDDSTADRADPKADPEKKSPPKIPQSPVLLRLIWEVNRRRSDGTDRIGIVREFANGNEQRAQTLARQLRKYKHLLD